MRIASDMQKRVRLLALTSSAQRVPKLRAKGCTPLLGNMDEPASLRRLAGIATRVIHLAPPSSLHTQEIKDVRTHALVRALCLRSVPRSFVYGSTSGVYGDCAGAWVNETHALRPSTARAQRRVDAERKVRFLGRAAAVCTSILRIPGIYALDRDGGTPFERLHKNVPVLQAQEDVYTNHIHADDLARACVRALWRGRPQRIYNINDDTVLKMGDYFDLAADLYQLPRPPRLARAQAASLLSAMQLSFMNESRRMDNRRMKRELGLQLRFHTVAQGLQKDVPSELQAYIVGMGQPEVFALSA